MMLYPYSMRGDLTMIPDNRFPEAGSKEITSSWALFIMIMLLMFALFTSYILQQRKIQAVHETVLSIFAGTWPGILQTHN
jgi:hypothetical protein